MLHSPLNLFYFLFSYAALVKDSSHVVYRLLFYYFLCMALTNVILQINTREMFDSKICCTGYLTLQMSV